jgi:hypothetical protein
MDFAPTLLMTKFDGIFHVAHGVFVDAVKSSHVSWKGRKLLVEVCCQLLAKKNFSMKRESICIMHTHQLMLAFS